MNRSKEVKNIEWLKEEIKVFQEGETMFTDEFNAGVQGALEYVQELIDQLDETETFEHTIHLLESILKENKRLGELLEEKHEEWLELMDEINNRETETLTPEWIDDNSVYASSDGVTEEYVHVDDLKELLVPRQEEVDRAYKDGYEQGREHGFYKGYREGLGNKGGEPETVADVVADFYKSCERLQGVMSMEVAELED